MRLLLPPAVFLLAGCSGLLGPSPDAVRGALDRYFNPPAEYADWPGAAPVLKDVKLSSVSSCGAMGQNFICPAVLEHPDGRKFEADIWMVELPWGWTVQSIVPAETS